ncbi:MAG: hypothetical protein AAB677_02690 [Patescibacteria group bacterium]
MLQDPSTAELLENLRLGNRPQKRTDWTVEEECGTKFYRSETGRMGVPVHCLIACFVDAGRHVKVGKKQISTAESTILFDFLEFPEDFCEFLDGDDKGNVPWRPFLSKGNLKNKGTKTAVCLTRPRIAHWRMRFSVIFDDLRGVTEDTVIKLVETAGRKAGLGNWRPNTKGRFGRFTIEKLETAPVKRAVEEMAKVEYTEADAPKEMLELVTA